MKALMIGIDVRPDDRLSDSHAVALPASEGASYVDSEWLFLRSRSRISEWRGSLLNFSLSRESPAACLCGGA